MCVYIYILAYHIHTEIYSRLNLDAIKAHLVAIFVFFVTAAPLIEIIFS